MRRRPARISIARAFSDSMDYYRVSADELHTDVVGDVGLA